jgi:hypothetical protein
MSYEPKEGYFAVKMLLLKAIPAVSELKDRIN